jgi:hypothetical protein
MQYVDAVAEQTQVRLHEQLVRNRSNKPASPGLRFDMTRKAV